MALDNREDGRLKNLYPLPDFQKEIYNVRICNDGKTVEEQADRNIHSNINGF